MKHITFIFTVSVLTLFSLSAPARNAAVEAVRIVNRINVTIEQTNHSLFSARIAEDLTVKNDDQANAMLSRPSRYPYIIDRGL